MTIKMGMKDAPAPSEGKSKWPYINACKKSNGKGTRSKGSSKSNDDNKYEPMLGGARGHSDGQIAGNYDQMGVDELMSTEVPTHKAKSPQKKRDDSSESETSPLSRTTQSLSCTRSSPTCTRR